MSGFTKIIYNILSKSGLTKDLRFIFIHKNLQNKFNIPRKKSIILDDDLDDFSINTNPKKTVCILEVLQKEKVLSSYLKLQLKTHL